MRNISSDDESKKLDSKNFSSSRNKKKLQQTGLFMTILPLAACGGGGGGGDAAPTNTPAPPPAAPPPAADPDFIENPANVFIARDDAGRTLSEGSNTANLTVTGGAGNDDITTGSGADSIMGGAGSDVINSGNGNDIIRAGEGVDNVNAGSGNDAIVLVGTTTAGQYANSDITNPAGSGLDLSSVISLADLNGRTVSEVSPGDVINGGTGTNTLYIYGTVDLTNVTLNNVTVLVVNSDVTLTPEQIAQFTTVNGDGTSVINIEIPSGSSTNYILDLSAMNTSNIAEINIDGDITVEIDDASDLAGIGTISAGAGDTLNVEVTGNGGATNVNLGDIADVIETADAIEVAADVTLEIDDVADITDLGLEEINGDGTIDTGNDPDIENELDTNVTVPEPTLSINDISVDEATQTGTFTVTLSKAYFHDVTVDYTAPDGSTGTLTFASGTTEQTFSTAWTDDNLDEDNEIANATLSDPQNATIEDGTGSLTIIDDDNPPSISINDVVAGEADETATFTVSLSQVSGKTISVDYTAPDGSTGTLTFDPGETVHTFDTVWTDDNLDEADETANATLSNAVNATIADNTGELTIIDDDGRPTINIDDIQANEAAQTATFTVTLTNPSGQIVTVDYTAPDGSTGTLTFNPGETEKTFTTSWTDDSIDEDDEIQNATLSNPTNGTIGDGTGQLTIEDNDNPPMISINDMVANEADETATFTVTLSTPSGKTVTVDYNAPDGSTGTLTFNPGETEKTFTTSWTNDSIDEDNEIQNATLSNPSNAIIDDDTGQLTIQDDDDAPTISVNDLTANEADETATFTVSLSAPSGKTVGVWINQLGDDFIPLTFNPGETEKTFTINWTDDDVLEADENEFVLLTNPSNATIADNAGQVTIRDDDTFGPVFLVNNLQPYQGVKFDGVSEGDMAGISISSIGDVNGDGIDDFIIGASGGDSSADNSGESYVVYGGTQFDGSISSFDLSSIASGDGSLGFQINGAFAGEQTGIRASGAGDVNNDGFDDFFISAHGEGSIGFEDHQFYLIYGGSGIDGGDGEFELSSLIGSDGSNGIVFNGFDNTFPNLNPSAAGDVNGDGYDDIVIGARWESYLIYGGEAIDGGDGTIDVPALSSGDGTEGLHFDVTFPSNGNGGFVANAGDVNNDGYEDVLIGADLGSNGNAYLVFGSANFAGGVNSINLDTEAAGNSTTVVRFTGIDTLDFTGSALSTAGDFNGDGFDDFLIGAQSAQNSDGNENAGRTYLIYGGTELTDGLNADNGVFALSDLLTGNGEYGFVIEGRSTNDQSGYEVSSIGDFNGDGFDDVIIGTRDINDPDGEAYILYGGENVDNQTGIFDLDTLFNGDGSNGFTVTDFDDSYLGSKVSGAGDVNNDGFDDILIGAHEATPNGADSGEAFIIYGRSGNPNVIMGTDENETFIASAATERFNGLRGDDTFIINFGDNSFTNDTFIGGNDNTDYDTLLFAGGPFNVDISNLNFTNLEVMDMRNGENDTITVDAQSIIDGSDNYNEFYISGDAGDIVNADVGWTFASNAHLSARTGNALYLAYENGDATLFIDMEIATLNNIPVPAATYTEISAYTFVGVDGERTYFSDRNSTEDLTITSGDDRAYIVTGSGNDVITTASTPPGLGSLSAVIHSGDGNDTIIASGQIDSGAGDDIITGHDDSADYIYGNAGADTIDGGINTSQNAFYTDVLSYLNSDSGITIDLETGTGSRGDADGDTFTNINRFVGSGHDDIMNGSSGDDVMDGASGVDILNGLGGDDTFTIRESNGSQEDTFNGGAGTDTIEIRPYTADAGAFHLDLSELNATDIEIIEAVHLYNPASPDPSSAVLYELTVQDVLDITDENNTLRIDVFASDTGAEDLVQSTGEGWIQGADQNVGGEIYNVYTSGGATLMIDPDIAQDIS